MMVRPRGMSRAWKKSPPHDPGRSGPSPWSVPRAADDEFADLLIRLREEGVEGYPPSMGLRNALKAALIYMRHNIPQVVIGEQLNVSQLTISRAIKAMTDAIARALKDVLLTAEEVPEGCDYVLGGTLFPCWSWRNHRELWSGKHGTTGMSARILLLPSGRLVWASNPCLGSMHDVAALDASGLLEGIDPSGWTADKGYVGRGMITPHKKPPNGELSEAAKEENKSVNRIRQVVERTIAHIKSWRILHTPYRRPLETFEQTITAALALYAFKITL